MIERTAPAELVAATAALGHRVVEFRSMNAMAMMLPLKGCRREPSTTASETRSACYQGVDALASSLRILENGDRDSC